MAQKVLLKKSSVPGKIPQPTDLDFGELALNYAEGLLYYKTSSNTISTIGRNASTASALQTARTISLSGDVTGSVSFDGSADVTISATISANSVALGTDTTGNYVESLSAGNGINITGSAGEGSVYTISHADTSSVTNLISTPRTYVSGLTFDTYGHVTGYTTASEDVANINTTYTLSAETASAGAKLRLSGSDSTTDDVEILGGTNVTVVRTDSNTITINSSSVTTVGSIDLTTTSPNQTVDGFDKTTYRSAKYLLQATSGSNVHCTEVVITHNDSDVFITEYATMFSGFSLISVTAAINSTTVYLQLTPTNNNTYIDFARTVVAARPLSSDFDFQGDLQSLDGDVIDLMLGDGVEDLGLGDSFDTALSGDLMSGDGVIDLMSDTGVEDLGEGDVFNDIDGDLISQTGVEDLLSGSGTVDLMV
jgi:hypothetical protein